MSAVRARVSESGRLSIPVELRKAVGLESGGNVVIELEGREIRIRTVDEAVAQAQAMARRLLADRSGTTVDDFLMERHREAETE